MELFLIGLLVICIGVCMITSIRITISNEIKSLKNKMSKIKVDKSDNSKRAVIPYPKQVSYKKVFLLLSSADNILTDEKNIRNCY